MQERTSPKLPTKIPYSCATGSIVGAEYINDLSRRMHEARRRDAVDAIFDDREVTDAERLAAIHESEGIVEIPRADVPTVRGMNRHERRAWAAQQRSNRVGKVRA